MPLVSSRMTSVIKIGPQKIPRRDLLQTDHHQRCYPESAPALVASVLRKVGVEIQLALGDRQ